VVDDDVWTSAEEEVARVLDSEDNIGVEGIYGFDEVVGLDDVLDVELDGLGSGRVYVGVDVVEDLVVSEAELVNAYDDEDD
jgi:hypothetical protein